MIFGFVAHAVFISVFAKITLRRRFLPRGIPQGSTILLKTKGLAFQRFGI